MKTYSVTNPHKLASVIRILRGEGFAAFAETSNGRAVLCTDARLSMIAICSGDGLWARVLKHGLPVA